MTTPTGYATLVICKRKGGRSTVLNTSKRGYFESGDMYYNHRLKDYPEGAEMNVVVEHSKTGRRMVRELYIRKGERN
jgi:hypothetical protein